MSGKSVVGWVLAVSLFGVEALAQEQLPPPAPYSLPWQLRPTLPLSVARSDTSLAFSSAADGSSAVTTASMFLFSYKVSDSLAPMVRLAAVGQSLESGQGGFALVNPVVGATYGKQPLPGLRVAGFLGVALPLGMGGGDDPSASAVTAARSGVLARSAMDNAMFAVNDLTAFPGVGVSYSANGFTAQLEATVLQLTRVRGEAVQPDASRTNFTSGLHLGYFVAPFLSVGGELRYQRWLSTPTAVAANAALRETATAALGVRGHFKLREGTWLRPGISYSRGLDDPMAAQRYSIVQLDVPFAF